MNSFNFYITTLNKTYSKEITFVKKPLPQKEFAGMFGFCQRFNNHKEALRFEEYLEKEGYTKND